jgi:secreted trypsin-like serine protease
MLGLVALGLLGCGGGENVGNDRGAIIGGTATSGDPAVVLLVSYPTDHSVLATCTATLIAPDVLLTAAHCIDPATHPGHTYGVFAGPDASAYPDVDSLIPELEAVSQVHPHPSYDPDPPFDADIGIALLADELDVTPLPIAREPLDASIVGSAARIVGYGQTTSGIYNVKKHEADTTVAGLFEETIQVGDETRHGCIGDSGGPALVVIDGVETVVGADSYTDTVGCIDPAYYRRTDSYLAFIEGFAPPSSQGGGGSGEGGSAGGSGGNGSGGTPPDDEVSGDEDDGGCAIGGSSRASAWLLAAAAAFVLARRRR